MRVVLKSQAIDLQSDAILEANRSLAATEIFKFPQKEVRNVGSIHVCYIFRWFSSVLLYRLLYIAIQQDIDERIRP